MGELLSDMVEKLVKLKIFGNVDGELVKKLLDIIVECYERLGPPITYSVNLNIYEASEGSGFFACHDALNGKPTINIYLDRFSGLPWDVIFGGVRRQAAHSILHGSPEYYNIRFPTELMQAIHDYRLPENIATQILYGAAMAAKEYAVTKFLIEAGFIEDQLAYVSYILEPVAEELQAWENAKHNPLARTIYLVMTVRDVSCAIPLLGDSKLANEIKYCLEKRIEHLPENEKATIRKMVNEITQKFSEDTFQNINYLVRAIIEDIVKKELEVYKQEKEK
jgi:histone H3/H4